MGRLIPAGTGQKRYRDIIVKSENDVLVDERLAKKVPTEEAETPEEVSGEGSVETSEPVKTE